MKYFKTKNVLEKLKLLQNCTKKLHGILTFVSPTKQESSGGG